MISSDYIYYVGDEIKYGANLYISGWKKLILHPWQTIKDTAYALYHPIETGKILLNEFKQHPIGMTVNIGLSWATGRAISTSIKYLRSVPLKTAEVVSSESILSSAASQVVQLGNQMLGGGCCGGICTTTAARISQTTSLITSQSESSAKHRLATQRKSDQEVYQSYSPYYDSVKHVKQGKKCKDASCSTRQVPLEGCKEKLKLT